VGIDCFTDYYPRPLKETNLQTARRHAAFSLVEGQIEAMDLSPVLDDVTHVFHLAAQAGVRKSWGRDFSVYTTNNIEATQRLLEACVGRRLERLVYASSSSVYGDEAAIPMREDALPRPVSPYGVTKLAAEQLCHLYHVNYGVPAVSMRYFTVYGPRQRPDMAFRRFFEAVRDGREISLYGDGGQTRDFTFVGDAVTATALAGTRGVPGRVYNIGGGSRVSLTHVIELIGRITGQPVNVHQEPTQKGDMRDTYADTTLATQDLGFRPSVRLEDGLAAEWAWLTGGSAAR
ncbi:MAG: NAD-dependent epimerase/dehydratase family protein, partial [Vicinamibacterales bacterium]